NVSPIATAMRVPLNLSKRSIDIVNQHEYSIFYFFAKTTKMTLGFFFKYCYTRWSFKLLKSLINELFYLKPTK
ncbi:MAG: hypothetical protein ACXAC2_20095, partial [Candidatus Kariarchaeaceae archaeon]